MDKVKLKDIAEKLGVSIVAVSKALNDKDGISDELKEKIKFTALNMGYESSVLKNERKFYVKTVLVALDENALSPINMTQAFYLEFFHKISSLLLGHNYFTQLCILNGNEHIFGEMLNNKHIAGIIYLGEVNRKYIYTAKEKALPMVFVDFYDKNIDISSVVTDNLNASYEITKMLIKSGHRDIGFVGRINATSSIRDRYMGYCKAMVKYNYRMREDWIINDRNEKNIYIDIELPPELPTAFVCNSDRAAYGISQKLKQRHLSVPDDVSIAGFDNDVFALVSEPQLTTVAVDKEEMSKKAVEFLLNNINNTNLGTSKISVYGKLIQRESVRNIGGGK